MSLGTSDSCMYDEDNGLFVTQHEKLAEVPVLLMLW